MSTGKTVAYIRVSTTDQNLDRQEELKRKADKTYEEKASAKTAQRPELEKMLEYVREGDHITVWSIDRLARSVKDLQVIVDRILTKGASIEFVHERMVFKPNEEADPYQKVMFQVLGAFAEFERNIMKQRQREGIKIAQEKKKYKGRKKLLTEEQEDYARAEHARGVTVSRIARDLKVSRATVYKALQAPPKQGVRT